MPYYASYALPFAPLRLAQLEEEKARVEADLAARRQQKAQAAAAAAAAAEVRCSFLRVEMQNFGIAFLHVLFLASATNTTP